VFEPIGHAVDRVESVWVTHSESLLPAIEGAPVPLQGFTVLALAVENTGHVDSVEGVWVVPFEGHHHVIEGAHVPL